MRASARTCMAAASPTLCCRHADDGKLLSRARSAGPRGAGAPYLTANTGHIGNRDRGPSDLCVA
eukprot:scaffold56_cov379-Prasinococcus_capsulatus_cf.AAC.5